MSRPRPARELAAWLVFAVASILDARAIAAPQVASLAYQVDPGPSACPDAAAFRSSVARQLHYDPFRGEADRHVAVQITRTETGFDGQIHWNDARGRALGDRKLSTRHPDCADLVNHLAFAVAVQLQLLETLAPPIATPAEASVAPPAAVVPPPPPPPATHGNTPETAAPPSPPARLALSVGIGPSLALALAPGPTAMGRLFVDGRWRWFSLELAVAGALPVKQQEQAGSGFSLDQFGGQAAVCGHVRAFAGCATGAVLRLEARGSGVDVPRATAGTISQVGARLVAAHRLGARFFAAARLEGLVLLSRCTVTLNDTAVWTTPRLGAVIGVDLGVHIF